ncbi:hypothetical protein WBP07_21355 (plasmid) [Novosphingobium sp. BL-8A]|uniref:hypothetical protein n=1 Tax=Novosphingobium sp. BL-8A TaxID=3127639 RepID=UPI00375804C2
MRYTLFRDDNHSLPVAQSDEFASEFKATEWARTWVKTKGDHDRYRFQQIDGHRPMLFFRTIAGQWYVMPLVETASEEAI